MMIRERTISVVAGYVSLGNVSRNLSHNNVARQAARDLAQCNNALRAQGDTMRPLRKAVCSYIGLICDLHTDALPGHWLISSFSSAIKHA